MQVFGFIAVSVGVFKYAQLWVYTWQHAYMFFLLHGAMSLLQRMLWNDTTTLFHLQNPCLVYSKVARLDHTFLLHMMHFPVCVGSGMWTVIQVWTYLKHLPKLEVAMYILQSFMADFFKCLNCVVKEMRSHSHHSFAEYSYHPLLCCMLISWQIMILHFVMKNFFFFKEGGGEDTTLCNSRIY